MGFLLLLLLPNVAYASLDTFLGNVNRLIINPLISLLFAIAVAVFLYGVFEFLSNQENEESRTQGKQHILWGVVGITIMMGVWGILSIALNTLNIPKSDVDPENGAVNLKPYSPSMPPLTP